uniref:Uncharacterized protein n=1 Tax=Anguilla anguilla TaxID=7936 RepID=A0A0E9VVJ4_ANGAN
MFLFHLCLKRKDVSARNLLRLLLFLRFLGEKCIIVLFQKADS